MIDFEKYINDDGYLEPRLNSPSDFKELKGFLERNPSITKLSLKFSTYLGDISELQWLKESKIRYLDIGNNEIGDQGVKELSSLLPPLLTSLNVDDNHLGPEGARLITLHKSEYPQHSDQIMERARGFTQSHRYRRSAQAMLKGLQTAPEEGKLASVRTILPANPALNKFDLKVQQAEELPNFNKRSIFRSKRAGVNSLFQLAYMEFFRKMMNADPAELPGHNQEIQNAILNLRHAVADYINNFNNQDNAMNNYIDRIVEHVNNVIHKGGYYIPVRQNELLRALFRRGGGFYALSDNIMTLNLEVEYLRTRYEVHFNFNPQPVTVPNQNNIDRYLSGVVFRNNLIDLEATYLNFSENQNFSEADRIVFGRLSRGEGVIRIAESVSVMFRNNIEAFSNYLITHGRNTRHYIGFLLHDSRGDTSENKRFILRSLGSNESALLEFLCSMHTDDASRFLIRLRNGVGGVPGLTELISGMSVEQYNVLLDRARSSVGSTLSNIIQKTLKRQRSSVQIDPHAAGPSRAYQQGHNVQEESGPSENKKSRSPPEGSVEALGELIQNLEKSGFEPSGSGGGACGSGSSSRRKRQVCHEREQVFPYEPLQDLDSGIAGAREARLYHYLAMDQAWRHPESLLLERHEALDKLMTYSGYIGEVIDEGQENKSPRENNLLHEHYRQAREFATMHRDNKHRWKLLQTVRDPDIEIPALMAQSPDTHRSWIFDNGHYSLLALFDGSHYQLYSQDFNYRHRFQTQQPRSFKQITDLVRSFFRWRSGSESYTCHSVTSDFPQVLTDHLKAASFWRPDTLAPDRVLLSRAGQLIEGIPAKAVRDLFHIRGQAPDYAALHEGFFQHTGGLQLRVKNLHRVLGTLTKEQRQDLVTAVKDYQWPADGSYLNRLPEDNQKPLKAYQDAVMAKLNSAEVKDITPEDLSELSYKVFREELDRLNVPSDLKEAAIDHMKEMHGHAAKRSWAKGIATQGLFFLPDIIRTANTGDASGLATMGGMLAADGGFNKLYSSAIERFASSLGEARVGLLQKLPITSPVMKVLTIYSIVSLHKELSTLPTDSPRRLTIQHQLTGQYITVGLMIADCFEPVLALVGIELGPLWIGLMVWQTVVGGRDFLREHQLDLPLWEGIWMELGGERAKLLDIFEERQLLELNLAMLNGTNSQNGWNLVKLPLLTGPDWLPINETQVPPQIQQKSFTKMRILKAQKPLDGSSAYEISEIVEVDGFRRILHFPTIKDDPLKRFSQEPTGEHWETQYYYAKPQSTTVLFKSGDLAYQEDNMFLATPGEELGYYQRVVSVMLDPSIRLNKLIEKISDRVAPFVNITTLPPTEQCQSSKNCLPTPVQISGPGLAALYIDNRTFSDPTAQRQISTFFDPCEGNMRLDFTEEGLKKLDALNLANNPHYPINGSDPYIVAVYVGHKTHYPETIIFLPPGNKTATSINSIFELYTDSHRVISQYVISSDHYDQFDLVDHTWFTRVLFNTPPLMGYLINSDNSRIIEINRQSIDSTDKWALSNHALHLSDNKKDLLLAIQNQLIDEVLHLSAEQVQVLSAQGRLPSSSLKMAANVVNFSVTVAGNLVVHDKDTSLHFTGERSANSPPIRYTKTAMGPMGDIYTLWVSNLYPVYSQLSRVNSSYIGFPCEELSCLWQGALNDFSPNTRLLQINGQLGNQTAMLELMQSTATLTVLDHNQQAHYRIVNHYSQQAVLGNHLVLQKVVNALDGNDTILSQIDILLGRGVPNILNPGIILKFQSLKNTTELHSFANTDQITLNDIDYQVQGGQLYIKGAKHSLITSERLISLQGEENTLRLRDPLNETQLVIQSDASLSINGITLRGLSGRTLVYLGSQGYPLQALKDSVSRRVAVSSLENRHDALNATSNNTVLLTTTEPPTTLAYNIIQDPEIRESNHSVRHPRSRQNHRATLFTGDDEVAQAIHQEFGKLDARLVDGLKDLLITTATAQGFNVNQCLGFHSAEDLRQFKDTVSQRNISLSDTVSNPQLVKATVWLIANSYIDLLLEKNLVGHNKELSRKVALCFSSIVDTQLARRIIRGLYESEKDVVASIGGFIENHKHVLQESIRAVATEIRGYSNSGEPGLNTTEEANYPARRRPLSVDGVDIADQDRLTAGYLLPDEFEPDDKESHGVDQRLNQLNTIDNCVDDQRNRRAINGNREENVASSAVRAGSIINDLVGWIKGSVGGLLGFRSEKLINSAEPSAAQHSEVVKPGSFLSVENVALIACVAEALDSAPSKHYRNLRSQGVDCVPSTQVAVGYAYRKFNSFVKDKIKSLDSEEKDRIHAQLKDAYPEIIASLARGVEFSGNVGLDNVLEECKKCFCTNIFSKNTDQSEPKTNNGTDSKPGTSFKM